MISMNEPNISSTLQKLGITENTIVETIIITKNPDGTMNPAPMGITRNKDTLIIKPYKTSNTYKNMKQGGKITINITNNPTLYLATAFKDQIHQQPTIQPNMTLNGSQATIHANIIKEIKTTTQQAKFHTNPTKITIHQNYPQAHNRGKTAAIEAIIHATRIPIYQEKKKQTKVTSLKKKIENCINTIHKVSPIDSPEAQVVKKLKTIIKKWGTPQ